jgi:hypothetical protein
MNLIVTHTSELGINEDKQQDIILRANAYNVINLYVVDENEAAASLTDCEIRFIVKEIPSDSDDAAVIDKEITSFTDALNGQCEIDLEKEDVEDLVGNYIFNIILTDSNSDEFILCEGNVNFKRSLIEE